MHFGISYQQFIPLLMSSTLFGLVLDLIWCHHSVDFRLNLNFCRICYCSHPSELQPQILPIKNYNNANYIKPY